MCSKDLPSRSTSAIFRIGILAILGLFLIVLAYPATAAPTIVTNLDVGFASNNGGGPFNPQPPRDFYSVTVTAPDSTASEIMAAGSAANAEVGHNYWVMIDDASTNSLNPASDDDPLAPVSNPLTPLTLSADYFNGTDSYGGNSGRVAGPSVDGTLDAFNGKAALGDWLVTVC